MTALKEEYPSSREGLYFILNTNYSSWEPVVRGGGRGNDIAPPAQHHFQHKPGYDITMLAWCFRIPPKAVISLPGSCWRWHHDSTLFHPQTTPCLLAVEMDRDSRGYSRTPVKPTSPTPGWETMKQLSSPCKFLDMGIWTWVSLVFSTLMAWTLLS